jgi:hypothetical protein
MKRSTWVSLVLLGGGVGLIAYLLFGELHPAITKLGQNTAQVVEQLCERIEKRRVRANDILTRHQALKEIPTVSSAMSLLKSEQANAGQLKTLAERLRTQLSKNRSSEAGDVRETIIGIQSQMASMNVAQTVLTSARTAKTLRNPGAEALKTIQSYAAWFDNFTVSASAALAKAKVSQLGSKLATYQSQSSELSKAYPNQLKLVGALATRIQTMTRLDTQLTEHVKLLSAAKSVQPPNQKLIKSLTQVQLAAINAGMDVTTTGRAMLTAQRDWAETIAALANDIDKVIIDMRSTSGVYALKYKIITNGKSVETNWTTVDKATYTKHKEHLGMTVYSKPAGVLPEDATVIASPPGYNYVGNQRYGRWDRRNGQSFWVFYGQYSLMRDVFWGRGMYRPIYRSEYRGYRSNIRSRRAYYGAKKQYGTAKAIKSPKYSKSSYAKKRASSGGYSGSKYSGSKRSGGYRGSRYRGSSFGGGGK